MTQSLCAIIPSYNHTKALAPIVDRLVELGLPVLIMDDGSEANAAQALKALENRERGVSVTRLPVNGGKGAAVIQGFHLAWSQGYTHALQIDADGQHDLNTVPVLIAQAQAHPEALISGRPLYDHTIPTGRKIGRWITHFWVFVETLSFRITDSMCGLRIYPLAAVHTLLTKTTIGQRMDFDTEIMVKLFWAGVAPIMVPVKVTYPADNTSNFDVLWDNVRISWMHTRLVIGLALNLVGILRHRPPSLAQSSHWAGLNERGALWGLRLVARCYRLLGRRLCGWLLVPIVLYFFTTGTEQRRASRDYLGRLMGQQPGLMDGFKHFMDFALRAVDGLAAWCGAIAPTALRASDPALLAQAASDPRGAVLVVSHHGNVELARALIDPALRARMTVLVHTRHAENYNRVLAELRPDVALNTIQVTELGPETAITLKQRVEQGHWIAIAGDRVPVLSQKNTSRVPFLGSLAAFSHGPWIMASLLECPVYLLFCQRIAPDQWSVSLERFADQITLPRAIRLEALREYAARYALRLESECREAPKQWYNFFDFWKEEA